MSSFGFVELIALLISLGDFGVSANPSAPSAVEIMRYAPADAEFMVHADLQAVVPDNYKVLKTLPGSELLRNNPQARLALEDALREIEASTSMIKGFTGIDPLADLHSLTLWLALPSAGDPRALVVMRGNLGVDIVDRVARATGGSPTTIDGNPAFVSPDGVAVLAHKSGELLIGTPAWVTPLLASGWKAPALRPGSQEARIADALKARPFLAVASTPSQAAVSRMQQKLGAGNVAAHLVGGHEHALLALAHNSVAWTWIARDNAGYERALMASEGALDLLRAGHHGSRGLVKIVMAGLHSYAGTSPEIDALIRHEAEILKLVTDITGDGKFKADVKKNAQRRAIAVTATGRKLSDVLPMTTVLPALGAAYMLLERSEQKLEAPLKGQAAAGRDAARSQAPGLDVQDVYRSAKRARGL